LDFKELAYRCKRLIMQASMSSEISVLGHQLHRIASENRRSRDFTLNSLTHVIREIIACFPVYRTYVNGAGVSERDTRYVELAVARARLRNPATSALIFSFVRDTLLLKFPDNAGESARAAQRRFVGKFQQVTGPVMAKAVEDTAFYVYNRLVSLNEVGGDPERFGITPGAFHQQNLERQARWPLALLPTSTHDTKRSEDVRARINVLSELPLEWKSHLMRWSRCNKRHRREIDGEQAPSRNDEYLLYQTLVGTWPLESPVGAPQRAQFIARIQEYMVKAMHEAKVNSSWISPNVGYEKAACDFIASILAESPRNLFLADFEPFARRIADLGLWNSLSQTLLKLTSPGVPDFYQGTELFDFSLVDPDNRRPVDYVRRRAMLEALNEKIESAGGHLADLAAELVERRTDSRIKLYLVAQMLNFRRENPGLFTTGHYIPLEPAGGKREHVCAFVRRSGEACVLVVVPRLVAGLTGGAALPLGQEIWGDTCLMLPEKFQRARFINILTGETLDMSAEPASAGLALAMILHTFPVAALLRVA
ncbi:MAG TPA: malto-oligosyltrehalose synthase, partial [Planctomycetaceae bacterium]|nr:malto-oligosyltrehalose synthase [Planctomycetaceae bacterium]